MLKHQKVLSLHKYFRNNPHITDLDYDILRPEYITRIFSTHSVVFSPDLTLKSDTIRSYKIIHKCVYRELAGVPIYQFQLQDTELSQNVFTVSQLHPYFAYGCIRHGKDESAKVYYDFCQLYAYHKQRECALAPRRKQILNNLLKNKSNKDAWIKRKNELQKKRIISRVLSLLGLSNPSIILHTYGRFR